MPEAVVSQLGLMACLSFVIGNIIGSGIFITPGQVLHFTGSIGLDIIVWIICGLFTVLGAVVFVELGTGIPSDGGDYAYAVFVNWKSLAFAFMTVASFLSYPGANAIQCATFGQYLAVGIQTFVNPGVWIPLIEWGFGALLLFCCTVVNIFPVGKGASMFQMVAVYAKALILFTVIAVGMYHLFVLGEHKNLDDPFKGSIVNPGSFALACYSALWSFAGWDILNAGAPSVKNPRRTLPLALIGGLIFVTVTYLLTNISFCVVLGVEDMKTSSAVAADFAKRSMGSLYHWVPFATALLLVSTVNGSIFALSRIMSKAAEEGHLPKFLAAHHKTYKTPIASLITQFFLCLLMSVFPVATIINYASVIMWGQKSLSVAALLKIRSSGIEVDKGVLRVPLVLTLLFFALSLALTVFPAFTETEMFFTGFGAVIILACVYHFLHWIEKPDTLISFDNRLAEIVCKVLNSELPLSKNTNGAEDEESEIQEEEQLLSP